MFSLLVLSGAASLSTRAAQTAPARAADADAAKERRLRWFREAKFGLFIHWGLYAVPAGEWKGKPVPGIGEWIMNRAQIPV
ncbi:MAG: alpha-L-fucosidase, partial [Acidobacteria bacterium]